MPDLPQRLTAALADRYRLERELGVGGMATVYLAHDVKHDRKVAVKVLKPELAAVLGAERFLNEIRVTANLQHPHILALYDSGEASGFLFYVMPYVEGEPLDARLKREKQLGIEEAVRIAADMAAALDYAHRHGVVHRDIKPANVLIQDGGVLVADFGIALALKAAGGDRLTETGLSLGTPHYMSPEQATGDRDVDARSDIYALGAVLYEMLAGEPPHTGNTIQAILSRVLTEQPRPLGDVRHSVPVHVAMTVEKALAKIPADRFATAADFAAALKDPRFTLTYSRGATVGRGRSPRWTAAPLAAALGGGAVLLILGIVAGRTLGHPARAPAPVARFTITAGANARVTGGPVNTLALSPDGQTVVWVGQMGGALQLFVRRLDELEGQPIPGTRGGSNPFFSPDGARLGYFAPSGLQYVALSGGASATVANAPVQAAQGATWLDDDVMILTGADGALYRASLGGDYRLLAKADSVHENALFVFDAMPDRRTVLAVVGTSGVNGPGVAIDTRTGKRTQLVEGPINALWYAGTVLMWARPDGTLLAAPFDPGGLRVTGTPVTVAQSVRLAVGGPAQAATSKNGALIYIPERPFGLMLVDLAGRREALTDVRQRFHSPRFSPNGRVLAVDFTQQGARDVWTLDLQQRTLARVTFAGDGHDPVWTPDGRSVYYASAPGPAIGIFRRRVDGSGAAESVFVGATTTTAQTFSPDGRYLITAPAGLNGSWDLGLLPLTGERTHESFMSTPFLEAFAAISPNGRWLAYVSDETGREEVYVRPFPDAGPKIIVSQQGGREPLWSRDGRRLYYIGDQQGVPFLMGADVQSGAAFAVLGRAPLFDVSEYEPAAPHANYDIAADGRHFAFVHQGPLSEIVYVMNVVGEVGRK